MAKTTIKRKKSTEMTEKIKGEINIEYKEIINELINCNVSIGSLNKELNDLKNKCLDYENRIKVADEKNDKLKDDIVKEKLKVEKLNQDIKTHIKEKMMLNTKLNDANRKYRVSLGNERKMKCSISDLEKKKNEITLKYTNDLYEIEKQLYVISDEINELITENKKYKIIEKKYKSLSNSKLGKLTLTYWNIKKGSS